VLPLVTISCNFSRAAEGRPKLLSTSEVKTLFHEFGHALAGFLSRGPYPQVTGSFPRDMVELPSQLNEHWAWEPEVMKHYARDYETGRPIPDALIAKFKESENFLKGLYLTDFYATALLDLEWHTVLRPVEGCDVAAFERAFLKRYDFPEHTALRFRTTYYNHIFASSYPAQYYSYTWSAVLDTDAFAAFTGTGDIFDSIFGGFGGGFGGGRSANPNAPRRGEDIRANVVLDFMEACKGKTVKLRINRAEKCPDCHGTGAAAGSSPKTCPDCHGTGTVRITQRTPFGNIAQTTTCSRCGGKGQIIDNPCHTCNGQGRVKKVSEKEINVPAGIDDGQTLRVGGEGNCGINGGPNGDLHINITVRPDPIFERDGYDVWTEIPLTYAQATLGDEITVPTVDGKVKYTVPEGTQTGTVFRLRGKGIKKVNRNDHGDHYVRVTVEVPRNLTKEQKEKLRDYEKSLGEKNYAKRKTFFDKLKDKFK